MERKLTKRNNDYVRKNNEEEKKRQIRSALAYAPTMGKECRKSAWHKSSKVPTSESANAKSKKKNEVGTCGECKQASG